jgi:hypothetical protein
MRWISSRVTKGCSCARVLVGVAATLLALASSTWADNLSVDCSGATPGAFTSIQAAINSLPVNATTEPHKITVVGTCGTVSIDSRQRITIEAPAGQTATLTSANPNAFLVSIARSRSIVLRRLVVSGGRIGLFLDQNSEASIEDLTLENTGRGILMFQNSSLATFGNTRVRNNTGNGITLDEGSVIVLGPATIENNGGVGLQLLNGAAATIANVTIQGNGSGASLLGGGTAFFRVRNAIQNNTFGGVFVQVGSTALFSGQRLPDGTVLATTIEGNGGFGVLVSGAKVGLTRAVVRNNGSPDQPFSAGVLAFDGASLFVGGTEIANSIGPGIWAEGNTKVLLNPSNTVSGNTAEGLRLQRQAVAELLAPNTFSGNGVASITCDTTALLAGDLTGITNIKCMKIERENGPPRPGAIIDLGPPSP